jgi:NTE family protein
MFMQNNRPVSLVLSSGGARGLTHIGVIEALEEKGYTIASIAGSSIGTMIGGIYAMGHLPAFKEWLLHLTARDVFSLMDFSWGGGGVMKGERVLDTLKSFIPDQLIETFPIPFAAVTSDVTLEEEVVFRSGSFYEVVRASIAIPAIFTPVKLANSLLIDGGVLNPLPIQHVTRVPNDILVVVNLNGKASVEQSKTKRAQTGAFTLLQHAYFSMRHQLVKWTIDRYNPDVVIDVPRNLSGIWDYHKASHLIEEGKQLALQQLNKLEDPKS